MLIYFREPGYNRWHVASNVREEIESERNPRTMLDLFSLQRETLFNWFAHARESEQGSGDGQAGKWELRRSRADGTETSMQQRQNTVACLPRESEGGTERRLASLWRHKHARGRRSPKLLIKDEARLPNFWGLLHFIGRRYQSVSSSPLARFVHRWKNKAVESHGDRHPSRPAALQEEIMKLLHFQCKK